MKKYIILLIVIFLCGCSSTETLQHEAEVAMVKKLAIDACLHQGGIPILTGWNELKTCQFKGEPVKE